jgi:pyruvate,water dikinase
MTEYPDPLHAASDPASNWTRTNMAEAIPGVPTPLGWTIWGDSGERNMRRFFNAVGTLPDSELGLPVRAEERVISIFHGRASLRVDFLTTMGDRLLGTSGAAIAEQLFDSVPEGFTSRAQPAYYPRVAVRMPKLMATARRRVTEARTTTETWWQDQLRTVDAADTDAAAARVVAASVRFEANLFANILALNTLVQPLFDQLTRLVERAGGVGAELMGGYGDHAETAMIGDLWACSRGGLDLDGFLRKHGYHGALELSGKAWREDPKPVLEILEGYRRRGSEADPAQAERARIDARLSAERAMLRALPPHRRPDARMVLALAARQVPLRGVGKAAFSQAFDVARASARRLGQCLAASGHLAEPDDVFYLTRDEIAGRRWQDARDRVDFRRERSAAYEQVDLPVNWRGMPEPIPVSSANSTSSGEGTDVVRGVGASAGTVEGRVRVMGDPGSEPMDDGDILVARVTDPSWASVMFLASALITDIGGKLSHAAVVARELGLPCVVGTGDATRVLRTGDLCRVDGTAGTVEILKRHSST